jgi:hypothetical protein
MELPPFQLHGSIINIIIIIIIIIIITRTGVIISCISWYLRFVVVVNGEKYIVFSIMGAKMSIW